jgi:hypothetical protein
MQQDVNYWQPKLYNKLMHYIKLASTNKFEKTLRKQEMINYYCLSDFLYVLTL